MEEEIIFKETKIYKFGEILFGLNREDLDDSIENEVKQVFADMAELIKDSYGSEVKSPIKSLLFDHAISQIINAELSVNKLLKIK